MKIKPKWSEVHDEICKKALDKAMINTGKFQVGEIAYKKTLKGITKGIITSVRANWLVSFKPETYHCKVTETWHEDLLTKEPMKPKGRRKSLVGWMIKDWFLCQMLNARTEHSEIYCNKTILAGEKQVKVRITISELPRKD